jgi:Tol biopolymer transport system component
VLRVGLLAALVAGLAAVPSSAALPGSGKIAYAAFNDGLYTVRPDGTGLALLRAGPVSDPRWSPDGSKVAFTEYTGTVGEFRLVVINADGTGEHVVVTAGPIGLGKEPWSPDGARIAWGPLGQTGDIYTASAAGGDVRRVTTDDTLKEPPSWSPRGARLLYAAYLVDPPSQAWQLFVARDDGTPPVQITNGSGAVQSRHPSWSPDGSSIAFLREFGAPGGAAIYEIRPDGSELRLVVDVRSSTGEPVWSPDGTKIAYTDGVNGFYSRILHVGQEIFSVGADGSGARRLTELAPRGYDDATPAWSPDGDRILFLRPLVGPNAGMSLVTMNVDGTCEEALPLGTGVVYAAPSWQPVPGGAPVGAKTCRAVAVKGGAQPGPPDLRSAEIFATVTNEGTEPLTNVVVTFTVPGHDLGLVGIRAGGCIPGVGARITCQIRTIGPGGRGTVSVTGSALRVGRDERGSGVPIRAQVKVTADGPLLPTGRETDLVAFTPRACSPRGLGRGRVDGTRFPDRICGRRGADDVHPLGGNDLVYAGNGPDHIFSRDGRKDVIGCGRGRDVVIADRKDVVARDCEWVRRP